MERQVYSSRELFIWHSELLRLSKEGKISLGISQSVAEQIAESSTLKPTKTTAAGAFKFWNVVASLGFFYSIYLSFAQAWWWFLPGIAFAVIVAKANKSANQTNLIEAAWIDEAFYDRIADVGGWRYKLSPCDAAMYDRNLVREVLEEVITERGLAAGHHAG